MSKTCKVIFDYKSNEPDEITLHVGDVIVDVGACPDQDGWCTGKNISTGKSGLFPDNFVKFDELQTAVSVSQRLRAFSGERDDKKKDDVNGRLAGMSSKPKPPPSSSKPTIKQLPVAKAMLPHRSTSPPIVTTPSTAAAAPSALSAKKFKVIFTYKAANDDELTLVPGDTITFLKDVEEGWAEGQKDDGKCGLYPTNFCTELPAAEKSCVVATKLHSDAKPATAKIPVAGTAATKKDKGVRELVKAAYPYKSNHKDELSFRKNDIITLLSTDGGDPGWWKGELNGKVGVFPDNFVTRIADDSKSVSSEAPSTSTVIINNYKSKDIPSKPVEKPAAAMPAAVTVNAAPSLTSNPRRPRNPGRRPPTNHGRKAALKTVENDQAQFLWDEKAELVDTEEADDDATPDTPTAKHRPSLKPKMGIQLPGMGGALGADFAKQLSSQHQKITTPGNDDKKNDDIEKKVAKVRMREKAPDSGNNNEWLAKSKQMKEKRQSHFQTGNRDDEKDEVGEGNGVKEVSRRQTVKNLLKGFEGGDASRDAKTPASKGIVPTKPTSPSSNVTSARSMFSSKPTVPTSTAKPFQKSENNFSSPSARDQPRSTSPPQNAQTTPYGGVLKPRSQTHKISNKPNELEGVTTALSRLTTGKPTKTQPETSTNHDTATSSGIKIPSATRNVPNSSIATSSSPQWSSNQVNPISSSSETSGSAPTPAGKTATTTYTPQAFTLPELAKMIQDQAKVIEELRQENSDLTNRVCHLEKLVKGNTNHAL